MKRFSKIVLILLILQKIQADISHLFTPDYAIFQQHPFHFAIQQPVQAQQTIENGLYGPPPPSPVQGTQPIAGYPNPVTPAPVAPTQASTEFFLPEIVENRSAKDQINFIPLQNQYLPPNVDERPNYESPKPPNSGSNGNHNHHHHHQDHQHGYYYQRPTTTTELPSPIIVVEPIEHLPPFNGYDYNAPPPPATIAPSPSTPAPAYLPPPAVITSNSFDSKETGYVTQIDTLNPLRVRIREMRCMQQLHGGGFFRAALKVDSFLTATPSVDNDSNDKRCELRLARGYVLIDILAEDFIKCGVRSCGKDICLRIRFPAIRGMRTVNDGILTLHCKSQERVAVKTHALKMGVANDVQSRSIGTYAHGGSQSPFRTHIELLRHSKNGYTRHLESNDAVQLGEDLLLRAQVLPGDGWNYTKLSDVSLQRISTNGELLNIANLITSRGCINPSMSSICNQAPIFDPPLGHKLNFKAVMFQGMHSGDELVMSMRITGCLEQQDCYINQQDCNNNNNQYGSLGRRRRDTDLEAENRNNHVEMSEISRISFRVIMDDIEIKRNEDYTINDGEENLISLQPRVLILVSSVGFVLLLMCLGVIAAWKFKT